MNYRMVWIVCVLLMAGIFTILSAEDVAANITGTVVTVDKDTVAIPTDETLSAVDKDTVDISTNEAPAADKDTVVISTDETPPAVDKDIVTTDDAAVAEELANDESSDTDQSTPARGGIDIDKLLADDDDDDLLIAEDIPAVPPIIADSAAVDAVTADGGEQTVVEQGETIITEDASVEEHPAWQRVGRGGRRVQPPHGTAASGGAHLEDDEIDRGPPVIEDGRTIHFAQNLQDYRSPRIAMVLSLIVPGLGQAYSRSYVKAAAFGVIEVAALSVSTYLRSVERAKKRDAHAFANEHFQVNKLKEYDEALWGQFQTRNPDITMDRNGHELFGYYDDLYDAEGRKRTDSEFYTNIRELWATPGWGDNEPPWGEIFDAGGGDTIGGIYVRHISGLNFFLIRRIIDNAGRPVNNEQWRYGYSRNQETYSNMINNANSYLDAANYVLYSLVVSHIVSAVDAGFTARAHNARLLGRDDSVWDRITVEQQYVFTGSEVSPGIALRVKF